MGVVKRHVLQNRGVCPELWKPSLSIPVAVKAENSGQRWTQESEGRSYLGPVFQPSDGGSL